MNKETFSHNRQLSLAIFAMLIVSANCSIAAEKSDAFNGYILRAVEQLNSDYAGKGKDSNADFTHDIQYGTATIKARKPPLTGCTAVIAEVIATAINLYVDE